MKRLLPNMLMSGALAFGLIGCGDSGAPQPDTNLTDKAVFASGNVAIIHSAGPAVFAFPETDADKRLSITEAVPLIDHQHEHGFEDTKAPTVTRKPIRIDAHLAAGGEDGSFSNDLACDTINVDTAGFADPTKLYMGALVLSQNDANKVLIVWDGQEDVPGNAAHICFDPGNEPTDGVVLFVSDRSR